MKQATNAVNAGHSCPNKLNGVRSFKVDDGLVLVAPGDEHGHTGHRTRIRALTLNSSGRAIWEHCDGSNTIDAIFGHLSEAYAVDPTVLKGQIDQVLSELSRFGMIEGFRQRADAGRVKQMTFVIGVEDKVYCRWQTAIFLESFLGKLPEGWRTLIVICNNGRPLSPELQRILDVYETDYVRSTNHGESNKIDTGFRGGELHVAFNRVEALAEAGKFVGDSELICLLDSDTFLYSGINFDIMPKASAMPRNWHIDTERFFSTVDVNRGNGVDLRKLLEALGCEQEFKPGGVNVFVAAEVAKSEKFIADCFRFGHALFMLGRVAGAELTWIAEMPVFALAMTANGIEYDLLEQEELLVSSCDERVLRSGTIYHYYSDPKDPAGRGAFHGSSWCKQDYQSHDVLQGDLVKLADNAITDHERYFFQLAKAARDRLDV
ncbi:MAG: PqqD family protein [Pseudomonadota bacterium]